MRQLQVYTYTIPALGSVQIPAPNDNFIVQASTGTVSVRGDTFGTLPNLVAGQGLKMVPFSRLELIDTSGAPNTVTILITPAEFVNQVFSGSVAIVGSLALDTATINGLVRPPLPTNTWSDSSTLVNNTPLTIFNAAANLNGAILWAAGSTDIASSNQRQTFVAKATAPASVFDGDVIVMSDVCQAAVDNALNCRLYNPQRIAAGLGLYFISSVNGVAGYGRHARYTLL